MVALKQHSRKEHEVLNYMVDLTLALRLLNTEEDEQLVRITRADWCIDPSNVPRTLINLYLLTLWPTS